jgi:hypothetical protein
MMIKPNVVYFNEEDNSGATAAAHNAFKNTGQTRGNYANEIIDIQFGDCLRREETKGHDFINLLTKRPVEVRTVQKNGTAFMALSAENGIGRKVDPVRYLNDIVTKDILLMRVSVHGYIIRSEFVLISGTQARDLSNKTNAIMCATNVNAAFEAYALASYINLSTPTRVLEGA